MAISPAVLAPSTQLTTSASAIYTCPGATKALIKRAVFTNTNGSAVTITVYRVPTGGAAATGNILISAQSVSAGQAYIANELANMTLNAGDAIYALASTGAVVNATMSGFTF